MEWLKLGVTCALSLGVLGVFWPRGERVGRSGPAPNVRPDGTIDPDYVKPPASPAPPPRRT